MTQQETKQEIMDRWKKQPFVCGIFLDCGKADLSADWWLTEIDKALSAQLDRLGEAVKGMKKQIFPLDTEPQMDLESVTKLSEHNKKSFIFNQALDDTLKVISQEKLNIKE